MDRSKRQTKSNIVGDMGEAMFSLWAIEQHLTANKVTKDIGIDFFCQVTEQVPGSDSWESSGATLAAQVKSVGEGKAPRIVLNRVDAMALIRQTEGTCLFAVRVPDNSVGFQFVDRKFINRLVAFLEGTQTHLTMGFDSFAKDLTLFHRLLRRYTDPFEILELRLHLIQDRLSTHIPGSQFVVRSDSEGRGSEVAVPWVASAFQIAEDSRDEVELRLLREGVIDPAHQGVKVTSRNQ